MQTSRHLTNALLLTLGMGLVDRMPEEAIAASGGDATRASAQSRAVKPQYLNPTDGSVMILVPAGTFTMGAGARDRNRPVRQVYVPAFHLCKHEITNRQWQAFVDANPVWSESQIARSRHDGKYLAHWEAGSCPEGQGDCLYIGDIGDNGGSRSHVTVYVVPEPEPGTEPNPRRERASVLVTAHLTYPGGPRDAEALLVDPDTGDVYIIEKVFFGGCDVFRAAAPLQEGDPTEMESFVEIAINFVTGADAAPDGSRVLVRNYQSMDLLVRTPDAPFSTLFAATPCDAPLASETQGEAIAFTAEGDAYLTIGEGQGATVNHVAAE